MRRGGVEGVAASEAPAAAPGALVADAERRPVAARLRAAALGLAGWPGGVDPPPAAARAGCAAALSAARRSVWTCTCTALVAFTAPCQRLLSTDMAYLAGSESGLEDVGSHG